MKMFVEKSVLEQALKALETGGWNMTTRAITALRAALAQQDEGGGNLPPPLQAHCPNCAGPETQNTELDRKAASAKRGEALYHPCTYILILGLKKLNAYDVLAEWDKARAEVDANMPASMAANAIRARGIE